MRKKKNITGTETATKQNIIVNDFVNVAPDRNRKDIATLKQAILRAESVYNPNRVQLYDLYHDVVTLDGHLSGLIEKRIKAVTNKNIFFADVNGKKVDEMDSLIKSPEFERLTEILMESVFFGISAVEFIQGNAFRFVEIDRRHLRPEKRQIVLNQYDNDGVDIDTMPFVWMVDCKNLGRLLQCSMYALYKRSGFGDFAQYVEIFGQPVRIIYYDAYDKQTESELRNMLDQAGSSLAMMVPKQAQFQMLDGKTSNGDGALQITLLNACNREMSVAILGNSETTTSSSSSGYAQAEVHADQQLEITKGDLRYILGLLNSDHFKSILASYGYDVEGGCFCFKNEQNIEKLKARLDIDLQVAAHVPVSDDYWYETYGIPKPDNYNELVRQKEEMRQAALESMKKREEDNGNEEEDNKDKAKKSLADFFAKALR